MDPCGCEFLSQNYLLRQVRNLVFRYATSFLYYATLLLITLLFFVPTRTGARGIGVRCT
jgi:hypothetical protein